MDILQYDFIQNAILAGILVSFISGIIGTLIVVNRMVFLAGGIAHASYGGIGIAVYFGLPMFLSASIFSVVSALLIAFVTLKKKDNIDIFIGLIWAIGMAIGIMLVDLSSGYSSDFMSYLFGSLLAVSRSDLIYMGVLLVLIVGFMILFYRQILAVSYDTQFAQLRGINTKLFYTLILIMSALTIVISIKVVGLILVIALLTIPIYIAQSISNSLSSMMIYSGLLSSFFTLVGLFFSYNFDLASGATIILVSAVFLALFLIVSNIKQKLAKISSSN
jgi:zinc transport system permease protein